jgi:hypothetical protein
MTLASLARRRLGGAGSALAALLGLALTAPVSAQPNTATTALDVPAPPSSADSPTLDAPALSARLARSLVLVQAGDARGVGVFVADGRRVLTAYALIDRAAAPSVTLADGSSVTARVVDWNADAGVALLELDGNKHGEPLVHAERVPSVGDAVMTPDLVAAPQAAALVAVLGSAAVSGASAGALWVDMLLGSDDLGRPIVSRQGELLGIVVANADAEGSKETPSSGTRARVAGRGLIEPLSHSRAARSDFEPTSHAHWENVRGLLTVPLASDGLIGAGFQFGYRREWFIALIREGFVVNGFAPQSTTEYERIQRRAFFELEAQAQLRVGRTRLFAGAGAAILADNRESRSVDTTGIVSEDREHTIRVRPLASIGLNTDPLEVGIAAYIGDDVETRLGIGLIWGR